MTIKKYLFIPFAILGFLLLHSCLSTTTPTYSTDGHVISFSLKSDSVPALAKAVFTIDQTNGTIYNVDSLPYGTNVKQAIPVVTAYSTAGMYFNDSVYTGSDTVDFSRPVILKNYAQDGVTIRQYVVTVNVHKVDPDSITWEERTYPSYSFQTIDQKAVYFNEEVMLYVNDGSQMHLFTSTDGKSWTTQTLSGLPATVNLQQMVVYNNMLCLVENGQMMLESTDGLTWQTVAVNSSYPLVTLVSAIGTELIGIQQYNGTYYLCYSNDGTNWLTGEALTGSMANFPISDFAATSYQPTVGSSKVLVVGGINASGQIVNSIFSYMLGSSWADFSSEAALTTSSFPAIRNASLTGYNGKVLLLGGKLASNQLKDDTLLWSKSDGLFWTKADSLTMIPKPLHYVYRYKQSVVVDNNYRIWIIGGKDANDNFLKEVWVGRLNSLGFGLPPM
ncbi:DUF6242 domain-containing protein [Microbacter margulisiae]|uniref:Uncharacterized protein n=1 Tax=Microbacter margulisiae TaxID=1350067 RepID=A0A7W5H1H3_9PORP|nr:DUF6242 domain-containing protein [Microbacter margulisiae]MBB3187593.1 hypothetical protein [Microbacter margulisiae]